MNHKARYLVLLLFAVFLLTACGNAGSTEKTTAEENTQSEITTEGLDDVTLEGATNEIVNNMSLEEKIGQLFIVCTDAIDSDAQTSISDTIKEGIEQYHPGGFVFFSYNMKNRQQVIDYISNLQSASKIPLFLAIDEEGGSVQRLSKVEDMGVESIPSMYEIGQTGDAENAAQVGEQIAVSMKPLGFNLNFAPVADICDVEDNTEIGDRSFGSDTSIVSEMVSAEVKALQENDVSATLKHFPGQGSVVEDTHKGYANLETDIDTLREKEFLPFKAGIEAGADFVMMSHISVEAITQTETPASMSSLMVSDILRDELNFDGVIITDAMNMKVITKFYSSGEATVQALKAGVDMILMPENLVESYNAVLEAVNNGDITEKQLNASVKRIIATKIKRGVITLDSTLLMKE